MRKLSEIRIDLRIHRKVRALHAFTGVPSGTTGTVSEVLRFDKDRDAVVVDFDLPNSPPQEFKRHGIVDEGDLLEVLE